MSLCKDLPKDGAMVAIRPQLQPLYVALLFSAVRQLKLPNVPQVILLQARIVNTFKTKLFDDLFLALLP